MKEFKGTKGGWELVNETQIAFSKDEFNTKDCDLYEHQYDLFEELQANAKLIAAAPELLKALLDLIKEVKTLELSHGSDVEDYLEDELQQAKQAINKALN